MKNSNTKICFEKKALHLLTPQAVPPIAQLLSTLKGTKKAENSGQFAIDLRSLAVKILKYVIV